MREGPVPANPGQDESWPGWEPVITCPDPQTAEEREALLAFEGLDPERYQDEDEFLRPGEEDFTETELAEISAAMEARAAAAPGVPAGQAGTDPAGVAQMLAAGRGVLGPGGVIRDRPGAGRHARLPRPGDHG
jgi:hypothetical protein